MNSYQFFPAHLFQEFTTNGMIDVWETHLIISFISASKQLRTCYNEQTVMYFSFFPLTVTSLSPLLSSGIHSPTSSVYIWQFVLHASTPLCVSNIYCFLVERSVGQLYRLSCPSAQHTSICSTFTICVIFDSLKRGIESERELVSSWVPEFERVA